MATWTESDGDNDGENVSGLPCSLELLDEEDVRTLEWNGKAGPQR